MAIPCSMRNVSPLPKASSSENYLVKTMRIKSIHTQMRHEMSDKKLFEQAKTYAFEYMDTIAERRVYPDGHAIANLALFDEPVPDNPQAGEDVLHLLHAYGSPATVAQTGGRYFGFVNGNIIPTALAAR